MMDYICWKLQKFKALLSENYLSEYNWFCLQLHRSILYYFFSWYLNYILKVTVLLLTNNSNTTRRYKTRSSSFSSKTLSRYRKNSDVDVSRTSTHTSVIYIN